jgi:hypothetical protein
MAASDDEVGNFLFWDGWHDGEEATKQNTSNQTASAARLAFNPDLFTSGESLQFPLRQDS